MRAHLKEMSNQIFFLGGGGLLLGMEYAADQPCPLEAPKTPSQILLCLSRPQAVYIKT